MSWKWSWFILGSSIWSRWTYPKTWGGVCSIFTYYHGEWSFHSCCRSYFTLKAACTSWYLMTWIDCQGVVAGLLVQNTLKYLLKFGHVSPYLVISLSLSIFLSIWKANTSNHNFQLCWYQSLPKLSPKFLLSCRFQISLGFSSLAIFCYPILLHGIVCSFWVVWPNCSSKQKG